MHIVNVEGINRIQHTLHSIKQKTNPQELVSSFFDPEIKNLVLYPL